MKHIRAQKLIIQLLQLGSLRTIESMDLIGWELFVAEMGQPLKTLETPKPVKDMVRDAFQDALKQRGLYSDLDNAKYILNVDVIQYDCNHYARREAHIKLDIKIQVSATNQEVFLDHIVADNVEFTMSGGIFGSVEELRKLAEKTLAQAVKDVFNNPNLKKLYQQEKR